jgi:type VI secretion system secreted protein Hcp
MPIYMQYEGITGDVTEVNHKGWVEINSFSFGASRGVHTPVGSTAKREVAAPSVSEIQCSKQMDISSFRWLEESLYGQKAVTCKVHFLRTGTDGNLDVYVEYIFTNCLVASYSVGGGGDGATESLSINFTKIEYTYTPREGENTPGTTKPRAAFDLTTAKKA